MADHTLAVTLALGFAFQAACLSVLLTGKGERGPRTVYAAVYFPALAAGLFCAVFCFLKHNPAVGLAMLILTLITMSAGYSRIKPNDQQQSKR